MGDTGTLPLLQLRHVGLAGVCIGEASHPGPGGKNVRYKRKARAVVDKSFHVNNILGNNINRVIAGLIKDVMERVV